jgi:hypothetical protein
MGVEWNIGCEACKKYIWLGSMKPYKWKGFQVNEATMRRFLSLHAIAQKKGCHLLLMTDYSDDEPWGIDPTAWQEDIISRSFWDSTSSKEGLNCGNCGKALNEEPMENHYIQRNQYLWLCSPECLEAYVAQDRSHWNESRIYDSAQDTALFDTEAPLEVGCTQCKNYVVIDGKSVDKYDYVQDFEYLAHFFCEHIGCGHLLAHFEGAGQQTFTVPWRNASTASEWKMFDR